MNSSIRWGICGLGKISADMCAALKQSPGSLVTAVAASNESRAHSFVENMKLKASVCENYDSLFRRDDVDVVYLGTINTAHYSTAMACINAGKSLVVEKPIGLNSLEVENLAKAAKDAGVFLMEGLWTRFLPAVVEVRQLIETGALGDIVAVHADFGFRCDDDPEGRMFNLELGGGGLLDIGIYPIGFASMAYGGSMPTSIQAVGTKHPVSGADTSAAINMQYGDGLGVITYNLRGYTPEEVVIVGTEARVRILGPAHIATKFILTKPEGRLGLVDQEFEFPYPAADPDHVYNYPGSEGFLFQIQEVQRCLEQGLKESPSYTLNEMVNIAKTMEQARLQLGVKYPTELQSTLTSTEGKPRAAQRKAHPAKKASELFFTA